MKRAYFAMVLVLHWAVSSAYAETRPVTVTADRVNLRAAAREMAEVVGQVNEGTVLASKSIGQKWVEIVPPETVNLWVHRDFVHDGIVATRKLNVRAGPGINFSVVGRLLLCHYMCPQPYSKYESHIIGDDRAPRVQFTLQDAQWILIMATDEQMQTCNAALRSQEYQPK